MFITALELPAEETIEEQIHLPSEEVSIPKPRSAFLRYVVESIIKNKVTKRRVYFPLDVLTILIRFFHPSLVCHNILGRKVPSF
jgi:hypothetical protein